MNTDRKLTINIPSGLDLPTFMETFTSEENLYMILVGSYATYTLRGGNIGFLEKDPEEHKALRKEFEEIIRNKDVATNTIKNLYEEMLEKEQEKRCDKVQAEIEREKNKLNIESIKYQEKIEILQEKLKDAEIDNIKKTEMINHTTKELENEILVRTQQKELRMIQEFAEMKLQMNNILIEHEKEKNVLLNKSIQEMTNIMQDVKKQTNKTNDRGKDGEAYFYELAKNTFSEYDSFEIIDKSKTPHSGDFHMNFARFTIMVDSKCFLDTDVPVKDRKKLKHG